MTIGYVECCASPRPQFLIHIAEKVELHAIYENRLFSTTRLIMIFPIVNLSDVSPDLVGTVFYFEFLFVIGVT